MVIASLGENYEVRLKEVPDGAGQLLLEEKEITVCGYLQGMLPVMEQPNKGLML